jgi:cell division protein FtsI/penicillin-binding protein 2
LLAYSVDGASIGAAPKEIRDDAVTAAALCQALGDCGPAELKDLAKRFATTEKWVEVRRAREVTQNQIEAVKALGLRGIYLTAGTRRWYPRLHLAAHLLGYVGLDEKLRDNRGLAGAEHKFDAVIRGREGLLQVMLTRNAAPRRSASGADRRRHRGTDDRLALQPSRARAMDAADHHARGGMVIMIR